MKRNRKPSVPTMEIEVMLDRSRRSGGNAAVAGQAPPPRTPRVTRLMALAVKYQAMVDSGELRDYADIARLGYVSRARMTQIMNLSNLAPDLQEELLFPAAPVPPERRLREVAGAVEWDQQRRLWRDCLGSTIRTK